MPRAIPRTASRGDALTFVSNQTCTGNAAVQCYVAIPRAAAAIRFDGGDRIVTSGGPLSIIHDQNPNSPYSGGVDGGPRRSRPYAGASSYSDPGGRGPVHRSRHALPSSCSSRRSTSWPSTANTQVFDQQPRRPAPSRSPSRRGQHYTNCIGYDTGTFACNQGAIDTVAGAAGAVTINAGTKISSTKPVAILLFTANTGNYATDFMPVLPDLLHGNDYILPSPGDDPAVNGGNRPLNIYAYNPDPANALVVSTIDTNGPATLALAANQTRDYSTPDVRRRLPDHVRPLELVGAPDREPQLLGRRACTTTRAPRTTGGTPGWRRASSRAATRSRSLPGCQRPASPPPPPSATYDGRNDAGLPMQPPLAPIGTACDSDQPRPGLRRRRPGRDPTSRSTSTTMGSTTIVDTARATTAPTTGQADRLHLRNRPLRPRVLTNCLYLVERAPGPPRLRLHRLRPIPARRSSPSAASRSRWPTGRTPTRPKARTPSWTPATPSIRCPSGSWIRFSSPARTCLADRGLRGAGPGHLHALPSNRSPSRRSPASRDHGLPRRLGLTLRSRQHARHLPRTSPRGPVDPTIVDGNARPGDGCPASQSCLSWALSPGSLGRGPAPDHPLHGERRRGGAGRLLRTRLEASALYSGRTYRARGAAELVRTDWP